MTDDTASARTIWKRSPGTHSPQAKVVQDVVHLLHTSFPSLLPSHLLSVSSILLILHSACGLVISPATAHFPFLNNGPFSTSFALSSLSFCCEMHYDWKLEPVCNRCVERGEICESTLSLWSGFRIDLFWMCQTLKQMCWGNSHVVNVKSWAFPQHLPSASCCLLSLFSHWIEPCKINLQTLWSFF